MRKIREILRLQGELDYSSRQISQSVGTPRSTVRECLERAQRAGLGWPLPEDLDDDRLEMRLYPPPLTAAADRPEPDWAQVIRDLRCRAVTKQLLWLEYKEREPTGYEYSWFCENLRAYRQTLEPVMRLDHVAGEEMYVDWAGMTMPIVDPTTGEEWPAQIFVAALGASNYTYTVAKPSQELCHWIDGHIEALERFGGAPKVAVPDNLKTGVTKACDYDPELNPTYAECAKHYGMTVVPARRRRPRDKAKVEAAVLVVERWVLAPLRKQTFFGLAELNVAMAERLRWLNERRFQKLPGSRRSWWEEIEKPALRPLPAQRYEFADWKKATVHKDYHVDVERHYYSVPYRLMGATVDVRFNHHAVEVFYRNHRVASHQRSHRVGGHTTVAEHMPRNHREYRDWSPERFLRWAQKTGPQTGELIERVLQAGEHPVQGYRRSFGILRLAKVYGEARLEAAAGRALKGNLLTPRSVESILKTGRDQQPLEDAEQPRLPMIVHPNLRGSAYYL